MKNLTYFLSIGLLLLCGAAATTVAQDQIASAKTSIEDTDKSEKTKKDKNKDAADKDKAAQTSTSACETCRWFEPTVATFSMRYRTVTDSTNLRTFDQGQQRIVLGAKFKFDKEGRYTVNARASSGYYFNWAYADTGLGNTVNDAIQMTAAGTAVYAARDVAPGAIQSAVQGYIAQNFPNATPQQIAAMTPALTAQFTPIVTAQVESAIASQLRNANTRSKGWNIYVRQLYFEAKPVKGLEFQYGSLPIAKGVGSEATSYDDDGYVMGGRVTVKRPKQFWFDEMSVTYGYLGDIFEPNVFRRLDRMKASNYHQFLFRKKFNGGKIDVSADYTFQDGSDTMREAAVFNVKDSKVFDTVRVEAYQRIGDNIVHGKLFKAGSGFYVSAEKTLFDRLTLNGGVSNIDRSYTVYGEYGTKTLDWFGFAINGDQTGLGKRFISKVNYKLTKDLGVAMLYSQTFANDPVDMGYYWNKTHFNVSVTYDLLEGVRRLGWFK